MLPPRLSDAPACTGGHRHTYTYMPGAASQARGPVRPFPETPLSGGSDYTLDTHDSGAHIHLVVEPSPSDVGSLAADCPLYIL